MQAASWERTARCHGVGRVRLPDLGRGVVTQAFVVPVTCVHVFWTCDTVHSGPHGGLMGRGCQSMGAGDSGAWGGGRASGWGPCASRARWGPCFGWLRDTSGHSSHCAWSDAGARVADGGATGSYRQSKGRRSRQTGELSKSCKGDATRTRDLTSCGQGKRGWILGGGTVLGSRVGTDTRLCPPGH